MTKYSISVNNNFIELTENSIVLEYKSNIFGDISKIQQSHSYTISIPRTEINTKILDLPAEQNYNSSFPRKYNKAKLYKNDIQKADGLLFLVNTTKENYNLSFIFGTLTNLKELAANSGNLNEEFSDEILLVWNKDTETEVISETFSSKYGFADYYYTNSLNINEEIVTIPEFAKYTTLANLHPFVGAWHILQKIQSKYNLNFIFNSESEERIKKLMLHCSTRNDSIKNAGEIKMSAASFRVVSYSFILHNEFFYTQGVNNVMFLMQKYYFNEALDLYTNTVQIKHKGKINVRINFYEKLNVSTDYETLSIKVYTSFEKWENDEYSGILTTAKTTDGSFDYHKIKGNLIIDVEEGDILFFRSTVNFPDNFDTFVKIYDFTVTHSLISIEDETNINELTYPTQFPIYANLPEITVIDFIKNICWQTGTFCTRKVSDEENVIRFINIKDVEGQKEQAYDISEDFIELEDVSYKIEPYTQENKIQYKEKDEIKQHYASIFVENETLKKESTIIKYSFGEVEEIGGRYYSGVYVPRKIHVPQYDFNINSENFEKSTFSFVEQKNPVIAYADASAGIMRFSSNDMYPEHIVSVYFDELEELIKAPILIECTTKINDYILSNLDFAKPVYIAKYGAYYAIVSITDSGETQKTTLIKLP